MIKRYQLRLITDKKLWLSENGGERNSAAQPLFVHFDTTASESGDNVC